MTERNGPTNQEQENRTRIITVFRNNFRRFLDEEKQTIKLISLFFLPEMDEPTISNYPAHVRYDHIDKDFEKVIERFRKSNSEPMHIPAETYKLAEFEGMSDILRTYVGKEIKVLTTMYELVSMPNKRAMVTKDTYYLPDDINCGQPIEEIWTAIRSEQQEEQLSQKPKHGSALSRPLIHPKLSLVTRR